MSSDQRRFLECAKEWICDGYTVDIRYLLRRDLEPPQLWEAYIGLQPLPPTRDLSFTIETPIVVVGQRQLQHMSSREIFEQVELFANGKVTVDHQTLELSQCQSLSYYFEPMHRDKWYLPLSLHVTGNRSSTPPTPDPYLLDSYLRRASPPFDGMADLNAWLGFSDQQFSRSGPSIRIQILPPVELLFQHCRVIGNRLELEIQAMGSLDTAKIDLAMRAVPGNGLSARRQIGSAIQWQEPTDGLRTGAVAVEAESMDSALVMLTLGDATIRRQWFVDPEKAQNSRLVATQFFDRDMRMLKQAVLQPSDANRFELGVGALLFILGFAPSAMIERDAPDLLVETPAGRLVLVECTIRIADFHTKLGKLIDRRGALVKAIQAMGQGTTVLAALVCALPRDQIAVSDEDLRKHNVLLVTMETLSALLSQTRLPTGADQLLDESLATLATTPTQP